MRAAVLLAGVLLMALLAGCASKAVPPAGLPVDDKGKTLPTLYGVVVDGAIRPLAGAKVRFLQSGINATTDDQGHYEIRRPTARAEDVLVTATMPGFVAKTGQARVSGHQSSKLDFVLELDATLVPRLDVFEHRGFASCMAMASAAGAPQGLACEDDEAYYDGEPKPVPPPSMWDINPTPNLAGVVVQVDWEATTEASRTLLARLRAPLLGGLRADVVAEAVGESPLRLEIPAELARSLPRWCAIRLYVELAPSDGVPVAAAVDQEFDAYASLFYVDPAPPGYQLD